MRRLLLAGAAALALSVGAVFPALAHTGIGDPCVTTAPGHSAYAMHHIVVLARDQGLGSGGHIPGFHMGYHGLCG